MKVFGLTGGVGMGKSTAAEIFRAENVNVVDTDILARQIVQPGQTALVEISSVFGANILTSDGQLQRDQLAKIVFSNSAARKKLEAILHPRIRELWLKQIKDWRQENCALVIVVIPLLFETQAEKEFDKIICVACSAVTQRERLTTRNWNSEQIQQRIAAQMPTELKMARSDFIIWTEGAREIHYRQIKKILENFDRSSPEMVTRDC